MLFIAVAVASPGPCYLPHWLAVQWRGGGAELGAWATEQRLLFWVVLPIPDSLAGAQSFPGAADQLWDEVGANLPGGTGDVGKGAIPAGGGGGEGGTTWAIPARADLSWGIACMRTGLWRGGPPSHAPVGVLPPPRQLTQPGLCAPSRQCW